MAAAFESPATLEDGVVHIHQTFSFPSIDVLKGEFRLLKILPAANHSDPLHCELRVSNYEAEKYYSLSYTWGNTSSRSEIQVNGEPYLITPNLTSALRYLRPSQDSEMFLWVDAICIDHGNADERAQSILKMHMIYAHAERVVVWTGKQTDDSNKAMNLIELAAKAPDDQKNSIFDLAASTERIQRGEEAFLPGDIELWLSLANFFDRPWWSRLWVVQEVAFARRPILKCGHREIDFRLLVHLPKRLTMPPGQPDEFEVFVRSRLKRCRMVLTIYRMAMIVRGNYPRAKLSDILIETRELATTDLKDKFYGCIHLGAPLEDYPRIDYTINNADLFTSLATALIKQEIGTMLLAQCEVQIRSTDGETEEEYAQLTAVDGLSRRIIPGLPSWAPNWAVPRITNPLFDDLDDELLSLTARSQTYSAAGDLNSEFIFLEPDHFMPARLAVKGLLIDQIAYTTSGSYPADPTKFQEEAVELVSFVLNSEPTSPYDDVAAALKATLTLNDVNVRKNPEFVDESDSTASSHASSTRGRTFFITSDNHFGLGPRGTQEGDLVSVICGCPVPIILRQAGVAAKVEGNPCELHNDLSTCLELECARDVVVTPGMSGYQVIGEAYVHGIMKGEIVAGTSLQRPFSLSSTRGFATPSEPKPATTLSKEQRAFLDSALRVNQAGELAATLIYTAQNPPVVKANPELRSLMKHMYDQEAAHFKTFNALLAKHRIRPTAMYPVWQAAATVLGWTTGMMGKEAAMACTEAVETEIGNHYNGQVRELFKWMQDLKERGEEIDPELKEMIDTIKRIRDEELEHLDHAVDHDAKQAQPYEPLTNIIRYGCKGAIWISERV